MYINDINVHVRQGCCNLYADDVLIYCTGNGITDLKENLQSSLDGIKEWYDNNRLLVNASKSNTMLVCSRQKLRWLEGHDSNLLNVHVGDDVVPDVKVIDYLGLKVDQNLLWNDYVVKLCKELNSKIALLLRTKCLVPFESLVKIYSSTIQSKIDYCITIWGYTCKSNIKCSVCVICGNFDFVKTRGLNLIKQLHLPWT